MSGVNKLKNQSLHLFFKTFFETVKTQNESISELRYLFEELSIARISDMDVMTFENSDGFFKLKCSVSDKRCNNFINSIDDKSTNKRTDSDHIRECLYTIFCKDNFKIISFLADYFKKNCTMTSASYEFINAFCNDSFENEDNKRELVNFIDSQENDSIRIAWIFVFLCFPKTPSEKNIDYRLKLLKKLLQSGQTKNNFQPLDITGNDNQIEKINIDNIGRSTEIEEIKKEMLANNTVLVYGIGGIGKSYICRKLFWNYYDSFSDGIEYLAWIQYNGDLTQSATSSFYDPETNLDNIRKKYENHSVIRDMFVKLALAHELDDKMQVVKEYFSKLDSKLLVFIDNADTMTKEEKKWLNSCKCRMIISSRQKIDGFYSVNINSPSPAYCKEMYIRESRGNNWDSYSLDEEEYIKKITELANYHTQTVMLIAKAQYCLGLSSEEMLDELNKTGFVLKGNDEIIDTEEYEITMAEHLTKIFNLLNVTDETQLKIICLFSLLAPNTPIKKRDIKKWFELKSLSSINELVKYGWINSSGSEYVSIHPVIADVVKYNNKPSIEFALPLINKLKTELINIYDSITEDKCINLLKHTLIRNCISVANIYKTEKHVQYVDFLLYLISALGDFNCTANYYYHTVSSIMDECFQKGDINDSTICFNFACVCSEFGDYNNAIIYTSIALKIEKKQNGDYSKIIIYYENLGVLYSEIKLFDKALDYLNLALNTAKEAFGEYHEVTYSIYARLTSFYIEHKNYKKAIESLEKSLEIYNFFDDKEDFETATLYQLLGESNFELSNYNKALKYLEKSFFIFKTVLSIHNSSIEELRYKIDEIKKLISKK